MVETKIMHSDHEFRLESGESLPFLDIAYETYGDLNPQRDNVILIEHALSGDAHAAFFHEGAEKPGWWDNMIGPGKAFDTSKYFIVCSNVLGGCKGTTGPSSINPATGHPYALTFPTITMRDMIEVQRLLLKKLNIERVKSIVGGSMGGMQAMQFFCDYPVEIDSFISLASTMRHSAQQIAFNEVGRRAIMADPFWNDGYFYSERPPEGGLSVARMIGHITYISEKMMQEKFGRNRKGRNVSSIFKPSFEVEHYLDHQGIEFVRRFDANSYLYITNAIDSFDLMLSMSGPGRIRGHGRDRGKGRETLYTKRGLVISYSSDWLYPSSQSQDIVRFFSGLGVKVSYAEITTDHGHDAFLTDYEKQTGIIKSFLDSFR